MVTNVNMQELSVSDYESRGLTGYLKVAVPSS